MESKNIKLLPWKDWESFFEKHQHSVLISGPCGAETESQTLATAKDLKELGVDVFRAGVWKPRTRPGDFEGAGEKALGWLRTVKTDFGMKVATEVANSSHVRLALEYDVDLLWLGARTTANPFAVQEIADTLHALGADVPILIKNPVNPDLGLWIGAVERISNAGIRRVGCIHRGFSFYGSKVFRNPPYWQIPIELKRRYPDLPIFCDPSHICGNREKLQRVSQVALDLNFEGLMIESHINPDEAWSDSFQQITPSRLKELMGSLEIRERLLEGDEKHQQLDCLRGMMDSIDNEILNVIERRMDISAKIGKYKKEHGLMVLQSKRWAEILQKVKVEGEALGLEADFVEKMFQMIHLASIDIQNKLMND